MSGALYFDTTPGVQVVRGPALVARERVAYPAHGLHTVALTERDAFYVRRALRGATLPASEWARRVVLTAVGLPATPHHVRGAATVDHELRFYLTREERAAVDVAAMGREFTAWVRDAARYAAGVRNTPYSPCADALIRTKLYRASAEELLRALPGRNCCTIRMRAVNLGLEPRLPDDQLALGPAAEVFGYAAKTLLTACALAGIKPRVLVGNHPDPTRVVRYLRRTEWAKAVAAYEATETCQQASRRLKCDPYKLGKYAEAEGHARPANRRAGVPWRLLPSAWDAAHAAGIAAGRARQGRAVARELTDHPAVQAARPAGETVGEAAARLGYSAASIRRMCRAAGLEPARGQGRTWYLPAGAVDLALPSRKWAHRRAGEATS